jgi:hypothetical protein
MMYPEYTDAQLKAALNGLLQGSTNVELDGRHLFGFQDPNHELSKLQSITAHRILDYETYLVRFFVLIVFCFCLGPCSLRACFVFGSSSCFWENIVAGCCSFCFRWLGSFICFF